MNGISKSWPLVPLREICNPKQWATISQAAFLSQGYPVYGANGVIGYYSEFNHEKRTVLITCRGATCGTINVCAPRSYVTGNAMALDDLDESRVSPDYLVYALRNGSLSKAISGTAQPQITRQGLTAVFVPLPPLAEQRRIAEILDRTEALRAKRRATLAQLDTLTQSIFLDMFGDPAINPKCWPIKKLCEVSHLENGDRSANYPSGDDIKDKGILFLSTKNIVNDNLDLSDAVFISEQKFRSLARGRALRRDLIITLRGTLGSCCIFECEYETAFINAQMMIIRPKVDGTDRYLHALITSKRTKDHLARLGYGVAVRQLSSSLLSQLAIPFPEVTVQREFARRIAGLEKLKITHSASRVELDSLFAVLQHRAFRGEL